MYSIFQHWENIATAITAGAGGASMWLIHFIWRIIKKKTDEVIEERRDPNYGVITEFTAALRQVMSDHQQTTREVVNSLYAVRDEIRELVQSNQLVVNTVESSDVKFSHMHANLANGQERIEDDVRFIRNNWPPGTAKTGRKG